MKLVNLTGVTLKIFRKRLEPLIIEPDGPAVRSACNMPLTLKKDGIQILSLRPEKVNLPVPATNTYYIVNRDTMMDVYETQTRRDLLTPTKPKIKDNDIIGYDALADNPWA